MARTLPHASHPPAPALAPRPQPALAPVLTWGLACALAGSVAGGDAVQDRRPPVVVDAIAVDLLTVTVRVVDRGGAPIRDLEAADLRVRARGSELPIVALELSSRDGVAGAADVAPGTPPEPGRVIFWLQTGLHAVRIKGHLKALPYLRRLLRELPAGEQVAVLSFDSRLELWQDFTADRAAVEHALARAGRFGARPAGGDSDGELGRHLDRRLARRAATPERALALTGEALRPLPGEKELVLVGWGLGRWGSSGLRMTASYGDALRALDAARASVFVLDVTDADYHTLELGLRRVARATGGSYAKTNRFPSQAVGRLARTLAGHYRLTVDRSGAPRAAPRDLRIELLGRPGRVLAARR